MMQYREPINISDIVSEVRRLWVVPVATAAVCALLFAVLQENPNASFEQRVDVVGSDAGGLAGALGTPNVIERFDADTVAQRERSKLEVTNRESESSKKLRIVGSASTNSVSIFGSAPTPEEALELANGYASGIVDAQRAAATERFATTRSQLETELATIQSELDSTTSAAETERVVLLVDRSATVRLLAGLATLERGSGGGVRDVEVVGSPLETRRSSVLTYAVLGALLGLVLGTGFVIVRRLSSKGVFGEADLARYGSTVPVLADITSADGASKGVFAALASAVGNVLEPGRVPGLLLSGATKNSVPDSLSAGILAALPDLDINAVATSPDVLTTVDAEAPGGLFHVVVVDDAIRDSASAIASTGRLASTVVVVRRRKTSIAQTLEAVDLVHQGGGQLRGIVIVD